MLLPVVWEATSAANDVADAAVAATVATVATVKEATDEETEATTRKAALQETTSPASVAVLVVVEAVRRLAGNRVPTLVLETLLETGVRLLLPLMEVGEPAIMLLRLPEMVDLGKGVMGSIMFSL